MTHFKSAVHKSQDIAIRDINKMISNGFKLQNTENIDFLEEDERLELTDSIIIAPDYQRDYRASIIDESSLVESILVGIPIPPVFLANDRYEGVQVLNVVDGQHRLRAFFRFKEGKFKLSGLKLLKDLNGKKFSELDFPIKEKILTHKLAAIVFTDFPGLEFELEIFNRYNKGTKPLTQQEIRHAVYNSKLNNHVNKFVQSMVDNEVSMELQNAYNATKDRFQKKKVQESIFIILSILEHGLNSTYSKSSIYAEKYMEEKSELEKSNPDKAEENFQYVKKTFDEFNEVIEIIGKDIEYPFSRELYGVSSRNYKFQISIAMIMSGVLNKMIERGSSLETLKSESNINAFLEFLSEVLVNSYLEDPDYNASSTDSRKLNELVEKIKNHFPL